MAGLRCLLPLGQAVGVSGAETLRRCPPEILFTRGRPERVGRLARWCDRRGIAPTLAEVEAERSRRRDLDIKGMTR